MGNKIILFFQLLFGGITFFSIIFALYGALGQPFGELEIKELTNKSLFLMLTNLLLLAAIVLLLEEKEETETETEENGKKVGH